MTQLLTPGAAPPMELMFDATQQAVLNSDADTVQVLGAPGTGKTTLAVELVAQAVANGLEPDQCVLLSPTRVAAGELRSSVTARIGGTSREPIARTPAALAFGILRARASLAGLPAPRLLAGPEQDVVLKELLAGHARGLGQDPQWPQDLTEALPTRGFRNELRDLLMRAVEWGLSPSDLAALGQEHGRPEWISAGRVLAEYDDVTALSRPGAYDPAWILGGAASALRQDPDLLESYRSRIRLVVVDDAQELTRPGVTFLQTLLSPAQRLVLLGDPDVTVQGFRGSDPVNMGHLAVSRSGTKRLVLGVGHRLPSALDEARRRVTSRIGTVDGAAHREVTVRDGGRVDAALLRSTPQEAAHIAGELRRAHLLDNVAWKDMAVIVRGSAGQSVLRRALNAAKVPVAVPPASLALRDEPAVRPFLRALELVTAPVADGVPEDDDTADAAQTRPTVGLDAVLDLLVSPLGAADPVAVRRLRRGLRREELARGGARTSDELLCACVTDESLLLPLGADAVPARRVAGVLKAGREAVAREGAAGDAEHVLWAMWQAANLAEAWEAAAFDGGVAGTRADRDLDAVVALFGAAATFVDRLPGASVADFLDHVRGQDVPGDRLVAAAPDDDAVALLTPAGAAGRSWHTVVIAGMQEGIWPDLRLRGSVLGSEELVDILSGRGRSLRARQAAVRYDETRQLAVAVSRARERLLVTAVRDEDEQPSVYLDLVDPPPEDPTGEATREFTRVARPLTLAGVVAEARRELVSEDEKVREEAVQRLARLTAAGVPGADPEQWWALVSLSDDRPVRGPGEQVRVSPSKIEAFHECGLNWLLTTNGAFGPALGASTLGTLVHELAQEFADADPAGMEAALDERWARLGLGNSWISRAEHARARRMVQRLRGYLDEARGGGWAADGVERGFSAVVGRAKISGSIDRVERRADGTVRVIDYKTGSSKPSSEQLKEHAQLAAYQVALEAGALGKNARNGGAALVQLGEAAGKGADPKHNLQAQAPLLDDSELSDGDVEGATGSATSESEEAPVGTRRWALDLVARTADGMGEATFQAGLTTRCRICPVRSSCPLQPEGRFLT